MKSRQLDLGNQEKMTVPKEKEGRCQLCAYILKRNLVEAAFISFKIFHCKTILKRNI